MTHYIPSDFGDLSNSTVKTLIKIGDFIADAYPYSQNLNIFFSMIAVFINIFHLLILTRKSMRANCINIILIGISLCDLVHAGVTVFDFVLNKIAEDGCFNANSYKIQFVSGWLTGFDSALRRLSAYLGIFMAMIRFLVIKFAMNGKFDFLSEQKFALKTVFISLILSVLLSTFNFSHFYLLDLYDWSPATSCDLPPEKSETDIYYQLAYEETYVKAHWLGLDAYLAVDGVLKILPAVILPILTILLVVELGAARKRSQKLAGRSGSPKPDHVTKLVTTMTVLSMIAEGPLGIAYVIQAVVGYNDGLVLMCDWLILNLKFLVAINSSTHFCVCLVVSSQYRNVAKGMFICKRTQRVQPVVQLSNVVKTSTSQVRVE